MMLIQTYIASYFLWSKEIQASLLTLINFNPNMNPQFSLPFQTFNICVVYIDFQMISNLIWLDNTCHNHKARV